MKSVILILTLAALASAANIPSSLLERKQFHQQKIKPKSPKLYGGFGAEPHDYPYVALIEFYDNTGAWYCHGSLISPTYVLSTARCANHAVQALVTLGAHNVYVTEPTQLNIFTGDITMHQNWTFLANHDDIAVLKLPKPVNYTEAIQAVALPKKTDVGVDYVGETGVIAGWGSDTDTSYTIFDTLRYTEVKIVDIEDCEDVYFLSGHLICTSGVNQERYVGICNGDEGGPLVVDGVQIGVVSFGFSHCLEGYPAGHTKLNEYLDWIEEHTDIVIN